MIAYLFPLLAVLLWAGNVVVSKMASGNISSPAITFYRLTLAVALMSCFVLLPAWRNRTAIRPHVVKLMFLGFLSMAFYQCLSYWAADTSTATNMAVITALVPFLTMTTSMLILREPPTFGMLVGGLTALAGIVWLISHGAPSALWRGGVRIGDLLMLTASLSYAFYSVLLRKWAIPIPAWQSTYLQALSALVFMIPMFASVPSTEAQLNASTIPLIVYAGVFASVVLPYLWIQGIRLLGPNICSMFMNLLPVFTAALAIVLLGENLYGYHLIGGGCAVAGVVLAQRLKMPLFWSRPRREKPGIVDPHGNLAATVSDAHVQLLERLDRIALALANMHQSHSDSEGVLDGSIAFRWQRDLRQGSTGRLVPIEDPQLIPFGALKNVDQQREVIERNTLQFLQGRPANNVLLTGARGTGKSSLVRACLEAFHEDGLRLIEVDKQHLDDLPLIAALVRGRPERFVVFCDDLSFEDGEHGYKGLKTVLDGSLAAPSANMLIYATSNRRHLVTERASDNLEHHLSDDGELHPGDSVEEKISLSERFGLWLHFYAFSQDEYLTAVDQWLRHHGFDDQGVAHAKTDALQWALARGARSGRIAGQFARDYAGRHALTAGAAA